VALQHSRPGWKHRRRRRPGRAVTSTEAHQPVFFGDAQGTSDERSRDHRRWATGRWDRRRWVPPQFGDAGAHRAPYPSRRGRKRIHIEATAGFAQIGARRSAAAGHGRPRANTRLTGAAAPAITNAAQRARIPPLPAPAPTSRYAVAGDAASGKGARSGRLAGRGLQRLLFPLTNPWGREGGKE